MAENYLITGYWGEPHVTAENDRGIHAGIVGAGRFVLPVGEQFRAEYIGNNTIRVYDGKLLDNGAAAGIPAGEYIDLLIANAGQGMKRNDLIVFQYIKDASTLIETGTFIVVQGPEGSTATDPELEQEDLLTGSAFKDQFPLWRVPVDGASISAPVQMFDVSQDISNLKPHAIEYTDDEFETGDIWIDGKPIYRKRVVIYVKPTTDGGSTTGSAASSDPIVGTETIINLFGVVNRNGAIFPLTMYGGEKNHHRVSAGANGGSVGFTTTHTATAYVIVEYTKTTD